jgi:hypothetical protein
MSQKQGARTSKSPERASRGAIEYRKRPFHRRFSRFASGRVSLRSGGCRRVWGHDWGQRSHDPPSRQEFVAQEKGPAAKQGQVYWVEAPGEGSEDLVLGRWSKVRLLRKFHVQN